MISADAYLYDWTKSHANFFRAVQIEKTMMFIILSLIVAVAAFNLVSTLVMAVTDKEADIAILRATLLRAQEKALVGFANLTLDEREELAAVMRSLVGGIDRTLREVGQTVKTVSGVAMPFDGMLDDNEDIRDVLEYISESLTRSTLTSKADAERHEMALQAPAEPHYDDRRRTDPRLDPRESRYYQPDPRRRGTRDDDREV